MENSDLVLRNLTYSRFVENGAAPSAADMARTSGIAEIEVLNAWRRLHDQHALVLNAERTEIRMANPFSAVPTAYRVRARARWWYANCAWDAFGICAALHADGTIESSCPDCGETISVSVQAERPGREDLLFHCLVPARSWWDDIDFTWSTMNLFRSEEHVQRWLGGRSPGATMPVVKLCELAHAWWADRVASDWRPHTREQNQAILERIGLTGEFWRLP